MKEVRCERCDNIIGMGCACPPDGSVPKARPEERRVRQEWRQFPGNAILIKKSGKAHIPGACDHMTEDEVRPPNWGWILDPPAGDWGRISEGSPAIATGGNARLRATRRCMTCMAALGRW
ncbi:hypothetical protein [Streptomyces sp. ITFR-6]|uniref:hypothetical protein n=1 Tax=Streptomyces sp. ITFR-6 TaxID=3075197 RepID=UPI00288BFD75|nr:hypothetical protein [Streptomyces sp. ITFR-6]WNI32213.1 hypothetical protein RLT59_28170 [Streptomyces sp. ITFR-6]